MNKDISEAGYGGQISGKFFGQHIQFAQSLSMIALIEPVVIAVMKPFEKAQKRFQTALSN
jgi:hypothetical protein